MKQIFFQSSLPRAGSTLLQNIIGQDPRFYVTPTSGVLELLYAARGNYTNSQEFKAQDSKIMKKGFLSFCNKGFHGFYDAITDKPYVIDKSRGWGIHYNFLNSFYPNPKIICMVRDLRSIFSSMEKKFRQNQHLDSGIVNHAKMAGTTTEKRVKQWANSQPIGLALERLYQIFLEGNSKHMMFIRYEDLTTHPDNVLLSVYKFFNITPYTEFDFTNITQITVEDDSIYGIYGDHKINNKLTVYKNDYKEILGEEISNNIYHSYKWFNEIFGYEK